MKTTRLLALLVLIALTFTACSSTASVIDHGETNDQLYNDDYSFWTRKNSLKLVTDFNLEYVDDPELLPTEYDWTPLPNSKQSTVEALRKGIVRYFKDTYNIDLTESIASQEIRVCPFNQNNDEIVTLGFYRDSVLYLESALFTKEYDFLFEQIYVHESLHQLGIDSGKDKFLTEGITDAFTDLVLSYMGKEFYATEAYFEARTLCYQLIAVDDELPHLYFESNNSFSMSSRISDRLKNVNQLYSECDNIGQKLIDLLDVFYSWHAGTIDKNYDLFDYVYDAQELVRAYCRTFTLTKGKINYIRKHYLIENFEQIDIASSFVG